LLLLSGSITWRQCGSRFKMTISWWKVKTLFILFLVPSWCCWIWWELPHCNSMGSETRIKC
jgi:hypothetical protein